MIGMFDPVVMDAFRTKPCTGLLSGDDLSIPGHIFWVSSMFCVYWVCSVLIW